MNASDTPLSGWTVYLDANDNGRLDTGETLFVSDSTGSYLFNGLPLGSYTVREVSQQGWGQTQPPAGAGNHAYQVTLSGASASFSGLNFGNNILGQVLGATVSRAHPDGTLILDGQTVYLIANQQRNGFRDPQEFASYGYQFSQTVPANDADRALAAGPVMKAMTGTLTLDKSDNRTVYMVGRNYTKRGFSSYSVFADLGYAGKGKGSSTAAGPINGLYKINLSDYPAGSPITSASDPHPEGALVSDNSGTVWWILAGQRQGFASLTVFNSYGFSFSRVVPANAADLSLPSGPLVNFRDGTLVQDGSAYYIISDGFKLPFASAASLTNEGYQLSNVIAASLSGYQAGAVIQ